MKNRKFDSYRSLHTSVAIFASPFLALHNYGATFSPLTPRYEIKLSVPALLRWCKRVSNRCFRIAANTFYVTGRVFVIFIYAKFIKKSLYSSLCLKYVPCYTIYILTCQVFFLSYPNRQLTFSKLGDFTCKFSN